MADTPARTLLDPPTPGPVIVTPTAMVPRQEPEGLALVIERLASNPSVDVDKLERIIALQERILAHESKAAFDAAFATMQGELPTIAERGHTDKSKYATLEDIVETVRPVLVRHKFSLSHRTEWPGTGLVKIIGILAHEQGHEKTSEFLTAADTSGSKNAVQALGSALSYGRRYTTMDLLNIVSRFEDDDGRGTSQKVEVPDPPNGFEAWADDMTAAAQEGGRVFNPAWEKSKEEYTKYALKYRRTVTEGWKATVKNANAAIKAAEEAEKAGSHA